MVKNMSLWIISPLYPQIEWRVLAFVLTIKIIKDWLFESIFIIFNFYFIPKIFLGD